MLWVGAFEHVPFILEMVPRPVAASPLVLLSNINSQRSRSVGFALAQHLGVPMYLLRLRVEWSFASSLVHAYPTPV